jgi:hypothetical protein
MAFSSVSVVVNALRLRRFRIERETAAHPRTAAAEPPPSRDHAIVRRTIA